MKTLRRYESLGEVFEITQTDAEVLYQVERYSDEGELLSKSTFKLYSDALVHFLAQVVTWEACAYHAPLISSENEVATRELAAEIVAVL